MRSDKEVAELFDKYNLRSLPVLDEHGRMAGVIHAEQVIAQLRRRVEADGRGRAEGSGGEDSVCGAAVAERLGAVPGCGRWSGWGIRWCR